MKYKVGDIVVMKIMATSLEGPHYTEKMRECFIKNPEVKIIDVEIDRNQYYVHDRWGSGWKVLEKWIKDGEDMVSYFIS